MANPDGAHDLVSAAHETLRSWVLDGVLPMGARLNVVQLARALNSSRTPVREALSRLTAEGFATFSPNRGHFVAVYSAEQVAEIYGCRAVLESEAARLAARLPMDAATAARLGTILDTIDALIAGGCDEEELRELVRLNHDFHETIYARCGNRELRRLIAQVTTIPNAIRNYFRFSPEQLSESNRAHRTILRALIAGDGDRAAAAMREHIWAARDRMLPPEQIDTPEAGARDVLAASLPPSPKPQPERAPTEQA